MQDNLHIININKIPATAVYSGKLGKNVLDKFEALLKLKKGELKILFAVDMFNEGLDVPSIDIVLFLRPTQSPTIFLQQLGRGLRKSENKKYLTVLDFIGNYKKANLVPFLLSDSAYNKKTLLNESILDFEYPEDCYIDFDFQLREELFLRMDDDVQKSMKNKKYSLFKDYIKFLDENNELINEEKSYKDTIAHEFLKVIENTKMTKSYKMPILLAFYNDGNIKMEISDMDVYNSMKKFYENKSNGVDMLQHSSSKDYMNWNIEKYLKLAKKRPIHHLNKSSGEFFIKKEGCALALTEELEDYIHLETFKQHFKDIIKYRTLSYYKDRFEAKNELL